MTDFDQNFLYYFIDIQFMFEDGPNCKSIYVLQSLASKSCRIFISVYENIFLL